jgi:hypothetical protein
MHALVILFQVHYGIYHLQMNTLLGTSSKAVGISGSKFFKDNKRNACPNILLNLHYGLYYQ